ncbi:helix-turn-helix transcriptional regulator [Streptosporangium sp. NBC_01495]|uniref:helix-turn-helix transcriptional regulator n=1 Tax=Streptosporangium sp. NBC_01495 TaxID=2903899 RepID=UPI002E372FF0|nr:helix-turn-helix transcriptional regulator [Streptosporangium sp. NBC_01495]
MDRHALGSFLRTKREQRDATALGYGTEGRRTPGLRRSEVAELAHISVEHYTNLEQARGARPSRDVLVSVSRALELTRDEETHLFELGGHARPRPAHPAMEVADSILQLIHSLPSTAALVLSARYDVLAWNRLAEVLLEDFSQCGWERRNLIRRHFLLDSLSGQGHFNMDGYFDFSRFSVGRLRSTLARYPDDHDTVRLVEELRARSEEFDAMWRGQDVNVDTHTSKLMKHEKLGNLLLVCDVLQVPDRDQHVVLLSAPDGSDTAEILRSATDGSLPATGPFVADLA